MTETDHAARETSRVAFITCARLPGLDPDDRLAVAALRRRGVAVTPAVWDDPAIDWAGFDLSVLRSTWDYPSRRDEFLAWARSVPRLANTAAVVAWNTDKRYLDGLASAGVPVVPTTWVAPDARWDPPEGGEWVIKPAVGAGSKDAGRYRLDDPEHRRLAAEHLDRLRSGQRVTMVQPYLAEVDRCGETALVFLAGRHGLAYSHAVGKGPMLTGPDPRTEALFVAERIVARSARPAELDVARRALASVPGGPDRLLYARVDLLPGPDGTPVLAELELAEPSLFLGYHPGAPDAFADATLGATRSSGGGE
jgi:hypothetical protein